MFSLKTTELKPSLIGITLWLMFVVCCALLLQLVWMPVIWRGLLFCVIVGLVFVWLIYRLRHPIGQVGMDELGVFYCRRNRYYRLDFVRVNGIQLIARYRQNSCLLNSVWPAFLVIYRDSVSYETYRVLRSFAAQQILLRRSEEASKRFKS